MFCDGPGAHDMITFKNKSVCVGGAIAGLIIPGANCFVWFTQVSDRHTYMSRSKKWKMLSYGAGYLFYAGLIFALMIYLP